MFQENDVRYHRISDTIISRIGISLDGQSASKRLILISSQNLGFNPPLAQFMHDGSLVHSGGRRMCIAHLCMIVLSAP